MKQIDFQYTDFSINKLIKAKNDKKIKIGVVIPTLEEASTITNTIKAVKDCDELVDKLIVVDSNSQDNTRKLAESEGITAILDEEFSTSQEVNLARGKGFNLWAGTYILKDCNIISYLDADIQNVAPRFVYGTLGPLIVNDNLVFVKGRYQRPESDNRVTRFAVEPILSQFFPEVMERIIQPLCGQTAGRRNFLESIPFKSGYSIEANLVIRAIKNYGSKRVGQVFLGELQNREHESMYLGKMATNILRTIFELSDEFNPGTIDISKLYNVLIQKRSEDFVHYTTEQSNIGDITLPALNTIK